MTFTRRTFAAVATAMAAFGRSAARAAAAKTWTVSIDADASKFAPDALTISAGDTVEWTNNAVLVHTVDFDPAAASKPGDVALPSGVKPFGSGDLQEDAKFTHLFTTPGVYKYVCRYHEEMGMVGTVTVN